jgi:hypothetical protein
MKQSQIPLVWLGAAVVTLALNAWLNSGPETTSTRAVEPLVLEPSAGESDQRIAELEARIRVLEERPLAAALPAVQREEIASADALAAEAEALAVQQEMKDFLTSMKESGDRLPDQLVTSVQKAVDLVQEEKVAARAEERRLEREQRMEEQVSKLTSDLSLDGGQVDAVRRALDLQEAKRAELRAAGLDKGREGKDALRELKLGTRAAIEGTLSGVQLEIYQASRNKAGSSNSNDGNSKRDKGTAGGGGRRRNRTNGDG